MTWEIALGIFALAGGIATIVKPIIDLTKAISVLTVQLDDVSSKLSEHQKSSKDAHKRLWNKNEEQDEILQDHETRIHDLEKKE